jgi:hypothetical protein
LPGKTTRSISAKSATKPAAKQTLNAEARAMIAAAQKARRVKTKKAARAVATVSAVKSTPPTA